MPNDGLQSFIYFVNFILRNVIVVRDVGIVHDGRSINSWIEKNGFRRVFEFSTRQLQKSDLPFDSKLRADAIVAYNPFFGMDLPEIEKTLAVLDMFDSCAIIAVQTALNSEVSPKVPYSSRKWKEIFQQLGEVVDVHSCASYHLFLVTKHAEPN